jgi:hypothetical protein
MCEITLKFPVPASTLRLTPGPQLTFQAFDFSGQPLGYKRGSRHWLKAHHVTSSFAGSKWNMTSMRTQS